MKTLILILISFSCLAQYPQRTSTLTVTEKILQERQKTSHGFVAGNWLIVDGDGLFQKGSDPDTQKFQGIVHSAPTVNTFLFVKPGGTITGLSGLVAGQTYFAQTDGTIGTTATAMPVGIATSTSTLEMLLGNFGTTLPPPNNQVPAVNLGDITSSSITATVTPGTGDGRIVIASASPIVTLPSNNVPYTADANFTDGGEIGTGAYVVGNGDISSVVITGLSASTTYYVLALEYTQQGNFITYNPLIAANSTSGTTLADATTPTVQFETTSAKSKETSIEIFGGRGNGDNIIAVASILGEPDTDPVDGADYTAAAIGNGSALGNGWVVYKGSASTFHINGLTRDRKVHWKIMEYENTGLLYNTQAPIDSAYSAHTYEGGSGAFVESTDPPGLTYLENESYVYYDFSLLTFADEASITNGDAGLVDQSGNANTGTIVNTPVTNDITIASATRKSMRGNSNAGIDVNNTGTSWFSNSSGFEVHAVAEIADGVTASGTTEICGVQSGSYRFTLRFREAGNALIYWNTAAGNTIWQSTSTVLVNGVNSGIYIRAKLDFVNDVFTVTINETNYPGSVTSGPAISAHDPTTWTSSHDLVVGNHNNNGSISGNSSSTASIARFAVTPLTTTQETDDIADVMQFTATAGNSFVKWDKEGSFDAENLTDSLHVDGTESGSFVDRLVHIDILPDTLEEYEVGISFKVSGALTTAASGLGVGTMNDLSTENNYAVMGQMNFDTDATSFGKVQIFSGNGTIDNDDFSHRATSSGAFSPAEDSTYRLKITRVLQGNDAAYTLEIFDYYDSAVLTIAWVETGRPSSDYYGTTNRPFIWYQGPDFMIGEFWVVRVGEDVSPPPVVSAQVYVTLGGVDTATGSISAPRRTLNGGIQRCVELGSPCVISMGPGRFEESTRPSIPVGVSVFGQGKDVTIISGVQGLEAGFTTNTTFSFIRYFSVNPTSGNQYLRDLTVEGRDRGMPQGVYVFNRDDIEFEDIAIRNFNTNALYFQRVDGATATRVTMQYTGGDNGNPPVNNMAPPAGTSQGTFATGAVTFGFASNVTFTDCTIDNSPYRMGYATKASSGTPGVPGTMTNITWTGGSIATNTAANLSTTANISIELFPCTFDNVLFENVEINGGNTSTNGGYLSIVNPPEATYAGSGNFVFDNIDYRANTGAFEFACHKIYVKNSYIHGLVRRLIWQTGISSPDVLQGAFFYNNIFELSNLTGHFNIWNRQQLDNEWIGNTFIAMPGTKPSSAPFIVQSSAEGASELVLENNIFQNQFSTGSQALFGTITSGLTNSFVRGNRSTNLLITDTRSGVTGGSGNNNVITAGANPWAFQFTGNIPFPYYTPSASLDGAGQGGGNIGAREADVP